MNIIEIKRKINDEMMNDFNGSGLKVIEFCLGIIEYDLNYREKLNDDPDNYIHVLKPLFEIIKDNHNPRIINIEKLKYPFKEYSIYAINDLMYYFSYDKTMIEVIKVLANALGINYSCNEIIENLEEYV